MKLNLGCGSDYKEGWINVDNDESVKPDVIFDITSIYSGKKLPYTDRTFRHIVIFDVLEHFQEPLPILREAFRLCQIGGIIEIKVPLGSWTWDNLDHKRLFTYNSFDLMNFDYLHNHEKKVDIIYKKKYTLPSRNLLYKLFRILFNKTNLHIVYRRIIR